MSGGSGEPGLSLLSGGGSQCRPSSRPRHIPRCGRRPDSCPGLPGHSHQLRVEQHGLLPTAGRGRLLPRRGHLVRGGHEDPVEAGHQHAPVHVTNLGHDEGLGSVAFHRGSPTRHRQDAEDDPGQRDPEPREVRQAEETNIRQQLGRHDDPHHQGRVVILQPLLGCWTDGELGAVHSAVQLYQ